MTERPAGLGYPASPAQQGVWVNERRGGGGAVYHMPFTLAFGAETDDGALFAACTSMLDRHHCLRSAVVERDGVPHLVPAPCPPRVERVTLHQAGDPLARAIEERVRRPFDLRRGPLIRMTLFTLPEASHVLLVVVHHLVFDGQSMELFGRDLAACYEAALVGREPPPSRHTMGERGETTAALPAARRFWRERWRAPQELALPAVAGEISETDVGDRIEWVVAGDSRARLRQASADLGVTTFELLLATLYGQLHRYGNEEPVITVALGLRTAATADEIGLFAHEIPLPLTVDPGTTMERLARRTREDLRAVYPFRHVPVYRAITGLKPTDVHTHVAVSYRRHDRRVPFAGLPVTAEWLFNHAVRGVLWIQILEQEESLRIILRYPPRAMARGSAALIARHWRLLLDTATATPAAVLDAVPLFAPGETARISRCRMTPPAPVSSPTAPDVALEARLREEVTRIWRDVLRVPDIGADQDIFEFDVDSLMFVRILAGIQQRFETDIPLDYLWESPTINGLVSFLIAQRHPEGTGK